MKKTILALSVSLAVSTSISAAVTENNIVYPLHIYEQLTIGEAVGGNYYYTQQLLDYLPTTNGANRATFTAGILLGVEAALSRKDSIGLDHAYQLIDTLAQYPAMLSELYLYPNELGAVIKNLAAYSDDIALQNNANQLLFTMSQSTLMQFVQTSDRERAILIANALGNSDGADILAL